MPFAVSPERLAEYLLKERKHPVEAQFYWDRYFLGEAKKAAEPSKDPSTKCGCVVVRDRRIVVQGYNGFPKGIHDLPERYADRPLKLKLCVHAEPNALIYARQDLSGCQCFTWPFQPCACCAALLIQAGIVRVVAPVMPPDKAERWGEDMALARAMFEEAGVKLVLYEGDL